MFNGFRPGHAPGEQLTKEQKQKKADFDKRQGDFLKEVQALSMKYKVDVVGAIDYRSNGIVPLVAIVDVKDKYEAVAKAEEEKKNPANSSLIV